MANSNANLQDTLRELRLKYGLVQVVWCNTKRSKEYEQLIKENKPIPESVIKDENNGAFYQLYEADITEHEADEYIRLKQLDVLLTISKYLMFFVALTIIGLFVAFMTLAINFR